MAAKYYLYRNLHTGGFSVKHRGRVVGRGGTVVMQYAKFQVSERGRQRAVTSHQRNVHAFAVADNYTCFGEDWLPGYLDDNPIFNEKFKEVTYNPFRDDSFVYAETGAPIFKSTMIVTKDGKLYAR